MCHHATPVPEADVQVCAVLVLFHLPAEPNKVHVSISCKARICELLKVHVAVADCNVNLWARGN